MEAKTLEFGTFSHMKKNEHGRSELGVAISQARLRYDNLIEKLGQAGSEVTRSRIRENDPDIFPYSYIRDGRHEFIFPPQDVVLESDPSSGEVSGTRPYTLIVEKSHGLYDEDAVRGKLVVEYDDSGNGAVFSVTDSMEDSTLPSEAVEAIEEAIKALS